MNPLKKQQAEQNVNNSEEFDIFAVNRNTLFTTPKKQSHNLKEECEDIPKKSKCMMSELCSSFLQQYTRDPAEPIPLSAKSLSIQFKVQLRRIYDLMNILEGLGSVQKLEQKGEYRWKGINPQLGQMPAPKQLQANSLKQIAARIKLMLFQAESFLSFAQINQRLFKEDREIYKKEINPVSLRRRIYQCCKILRILGLIRRVQKNYIWADKQTDNVHITSKSTKKSRYLIPRPRMISITEKTLIKEITKRYKTPEALQQFVQKIHTALKQQNPTTIKKQDIDDDIIE